VRAELVAPPTGVDVMTYLGRGEPSAGALTQAGAHVEHLTAMVRAVTRGRGFDTTGDNLRVTADLAAVIVSAAGRLVTNPSGVREQNAPGVASVTYTDFKGFNLAETLVLNSHRKRAA